MAQAAAAAGAAAAAAPTTGTDRGIMAVKAEAITGKRGSAADAYPDTVHTECACQLLSNKPGYNWQSQKTL